MTRLALPAAVLCLILLTLALLKVEHEPANGGLPLVKAASACPRLANPCDRVNCNRTETRRIA